MVLGLFFFYATIRELVSNVHTVKSKLFKQTNLFEG